MLIYVYIFTAKPTKLSCMLHQTAEGLPGLFTCSWEHQGNSLPTNYSVLWWVLVLQWKFSFFLLFNNTRFSFSLSCTSVTELCRSNETTCTSDFSRMKEMHLRGRYNVTVSAKSTFWEVFSDRYEITPSTIRKVNSIEKEKHPFLCTNVLHLVVSWSSHPLSEYYPTGAQRHHCLWQSSGWMEDPVMPLRVFVSLPTEIQGMLILGSSMGGDTKNIHATESRFTTSSIFHCFLWWSLMSKSQNFTLLICTQHLISAAQSHNLRREIRMVAVERVPLLQLSERHMKSRMRWSKTHLKAVSNFHPPPIHTQLRLIQRSFTRGFAITHLGGCESSPKSPVRLHCIQEMAVNCSSPRLLTEYKPDPCCVAIQLCKSILEQMSLILSRQSVLTHRR